MDNWLLGYCHLCPDGNRPGRIEILASLRRKVHGVYVVDRVADELQDEVGPTRRVFWPQYPGVPIDYRGSVIRFMAEKAGDFYGNDEGKDWLKVQREGNIWAVERIGFRVVEQGPDLQWRQEPRWVRGFTEGERVFIRQRATSMLIGPWRIGREITDESRARELIPHPNPNKVFEYAVKDLAHDCIYSKMLSTGSFLEALLYVPDEAHGRPVDLATPKQLAKWLVERLVASTPQLVARLDQEIPNWRTKLRSGIEGNSEWERELHRLRWQRIEASLDDLIFEAESVEKLLQTAKFKSIIEQIVKTKVEEQVTVRVNEIEAEAQLKAKSTIERLDRETQEVEEKLRKAKEKYDLMVTEIKTRHDAAVERETAVRELESHLKDSRERLLKDLSLYQSLLPTVLSHPTSSFPTPACSGLAMQPVPAVRPTGPPIADGAAFIDSRLWPSLARWHPGVPRILSVILHGTVCGSKAVLIPSPAWARAYADALGAFASLTTLNVEPTWLGFGDLWRGGLGVCWERAIRDGSRIELVLLRDFNRALPQCYARPLLDIIAGYCDTLPEPARSCWPKTLRLLACPAPSDESLPLTAEVVRHFAAVQRVSAAAGNERPKQLAQGHVTTETWSLWAQAAALADPEQDLVTEFGTLAYAAAADAATIAQVLRAHGMAEREAKRTARDARVSEPSEYLTPQASGIGGS